MAALTTRMLATTRLELAGRDEVAPEPEEILGTRYTIVEVLGSGGFSTVYRAQSADHGRTVAIKVLHPQPGPLGVGLRKRFEREAHALASLCHPNVVRLLDRGMTGQGAPYLVLDLVKGESLRDRLDRAGLGIGRSLDITRQILRGLCHAHDRGISHLDLKPSNIMLSMAPAGRDHVTILDFGFATYTSGPGRRDETPAIAAGVGFGTPGYLAPERMTGHQGGPAADVYAVGAMLYEMIAGRRPFEGTAHEMMQAHLLYPIPSLDVVAPGRDPGGTLDALIRRSMAKDAGLRFAHARDMLAALEELAGPERTQPVVLAPRTEPAVRPSARGTLTVAMIAAACLLALAVGTGVASQMRSEEPPPRTPSTHSHGR